MIKLPSVYPGDKVIWPNGFGVITVPENVEDDGKILLYNETPLNIDLDFENGDTDVIHAWEANWWLLDSSVNEIRWQIDADSLNTISPPINALYPKYYYPRESLKDKAYPLALVRQLGGQQAIVSSASQTINDGNALQQVVEATLQGHSTSDVIINNDGSYTLKGAGVVALAGILTHILGSLTVDQLATFNAGINSSGPDTHGAVGVLTHILGTLTVDQLATFNAGINSSGPDTHGAVGVLTHILGTLTVDQNVTFSSGLTVTGTSTIHTASINTITPGGSSDFVVNPASGHKINFEIAGVSEATIDSVNFTALGVDIRLSGSQHFQFLSGSSSRQQGGHVATATATVTHGMGNVPAFCLIGSDIAQPGSATVGAGNLGSTTFDGHVGAGTAFWWMCLSG